MRFFVFILMVGFGAPLFADGKPNVDPKFDLLRNVVKKFGPDCALFGYTPNHQMGIGVSGSLRFANPLSSKEIAELQIAGVEFRLSDGVPISLGHIYPAFIRWEALPYLKNFRPLVRAEVSWVPVILTPLDVTSPEIGARQSATRPLNAATGTGVTIAAIDSGIDALHPHFFRADGSSFRWIDVDQNGAFSGGDGVDLDGDGEISRSERLGILDGVAVKGDGEVLGRDDIFQPLTDWLFADLNEDGERNAGRSSGFTEEDPGYGEPIFVADDVNTNGVLDLHEPIVMLKTSKISRYVTPQESYARDENLIDSADDLDLLDEAFHGNGVASIAIGGQVEYHARVGIAPGADFVMYTYDDSLAFDAQLAAIMDATRNEYTAIIHEWTSPFVSPHDGSGNVEAAMDASRDLGVIHVTPVGNLNESEKHTELTLTGNIDAVAFQVPAGYANFHGSFFWKGVPLQTIQIQPPNATGVDVPLDGTQIQIGELWISAVFEQTTRGTQQLTFFAWVDDPETIPMGEWNFQISGTTGDRVFARISDYITGWNRGIGWSSPVTDHATAVFPSTADSAFGVGAFGGRDDVMGVPAGALRRYSGRGPRIDGAPVVDITGPDDPFAALPASPVFLAIGYGRTWFGKFGGTSGSAPHVAGSIALLKEQQPNWTANQIETRLVDSAKSTGLMPDLGTTPNDGWGAGKVDVFSALFDRTFRENSAPTLVVTIDNDTVNASETTDPDDDDLFFRFDFDNDGVFEIDWQPDSVVSSETFGEFVRIDVKDTFGGRDGRILRTTIGTLEEVSDDSVSDMGPPPTRRKKGCCATVSPNPTPLFLVLLLAFYPRRRRSSIKPIPSSASDGVSPMLTTSNFPREKSGPTL